MRITSVEGIPVDAGHTPLAERHMRLRYGDWSLSEVCKVTTDNGLVGWGETISHYTWGSPTVTDQAIERVIGRNPAELLWDGSLGAGLQQAMFDLTGKALGVPAYRLIGTKVRDWCPIAWWCIDMPPEDWAAEAQEAVENGYAAFKFKARPWFDIVAQMQAVDAVTPDHAVFDLDFNEWLLDAGTALPVLRELERFAKVKIFETPIPTNDVAGNKSLRAKLERPTALHTGTPPFVTAVREAVCDGLVVNRDADDNRHHAELAAEANMPFWLQLVGTGITSAFAAHQGAVFAAARWPAVTCLNTYTNNLLIEPLRIERGYLRVPEAPGLGIDVNEDALERLRRDDMRTKPCPRAIYRVAWADGRTAEYTRAERLERDFMDGNQPGFERGVELECEEDDGSVDFNDRHAAIEHAGVLVANP